MCVCFFHCTFVLIRTHGSVCIGYREEDSDGRESSIGCLPHAPELGIEPATWMCVCPDPELNPPPVGVWTTLQPPEPPTRALLLSISLDIGSLPAYLYTSSVAGRAGSPLGRRRRRPRVRVVSFCQPDAMVWPSWCGGLSCPTVPAWSSPPAAGGRSDRARVCGRACVPL